MALEQARARDPRALEDPAALFAWGRALGRAGRGAEAEAAFHSLLPRAANLPLADRGAAEIEAGLLAQARGPAGIDEAIATFREAQKDAQDSLQALAALTLALALDRADQREESRLLLSTAPHGDPRELLTDARVRDVLTDVSAVGEGDALIALPPRVERRRGGARSVGALRRRSGRQRAVGRSRARARSPSIPGGAMSRPRLRGTTLAMGLGALGLLAATANADTPPDRWDAIANTALADRYALHVRAREILHSAAIAERSNDVAIAIGLRNRARMFLEEGHAATSPDVVLRFDLGEVCYALEDNHCAIDVLEKALALAPDHPAALPAYSILANAYAKLDQSTAERRVYARYLPRIAEDESRAIAMLNLAEADMHVGDLDDAIAGYQETIDAAAQLPNIVELEQRTGLLARWGLAVALDRSGDIAGGARETRVALQLDTDMREIKVGPNVFFAPERERYWYVALGYAEYAKGASDAHSSALLWHRAEGCWREYLEDVRVKAANDRWVVQAKAHPEKAHALRVAAERRTPRRIVYPQYDCAR